MSVRIFLSTVSDEFRRYRDLLRTDLERHNVEVKVQEDFRDLGGETLDKLDVYIAHCDAVVHLVGEMTGSYPGERGLSALLAKYPDLPTKLPPLSAALKDGVGISYTQWEAWLALYHCKLLLIARAAETAEREPKYEPTDAASKAQETHLTRLKAVERYPGCTFTSADSLAKYVLGGAILDLLVEEYAEEVVAALEAKGGLLGSELAGLQRRTILSLAQRLKPDVPNFEQAVTELERAVEVALDVIERGERGTNDDAFVNKVLARVAETVRNDDFDAASMAIDTALIELEARRRQSKIALLEEGTKVDTLRRDPVAVARRIEALVAVDQPTERPAWLQAFRGRYYALCDDGEKKGINFSLGVAIELARRMLATAQTNRERSAAANRLGNALSLLGEREGRRELLEEAVTTYQEALKERTRETVPFKWATTQNNLGNALRRLAGRERSSELLEQAVSAYRAALKERTRKRVPLKWATTQSNLGSALWRLGSRESGTARLEEAVSAYRAALKERTRKRAPLKWATTQSNLGHALRRLGEREAGTARLEEAVAAYRAALRKRTRDKVPLDWATTQSSLGTALLRLGEREAGTARLEEAVATYRLALEERTRDKVPLDWATTQSNLGHALRRLGEREAGTARLEEAVATYHLALEERTRDRVPLKWATTQSNLGTALLRLGEREAGTVRLEEAVATYRLALEERTRNVVPIAWAETQNGLANALAVLAQRRSGTVLLEEAIKAWKACLTIEVSTWPQAHIQEIRFHMTKALAEKARRAQQQPDSFSV